MSVHTLLAIMAIVLSFVSFFFIVRSFLSTQRQIKTRIMFNHSDFSEKGRVCAYVLRTGVHSLKGPTKAIVRIRFVSRFLEDLCAYVNSLGYECSQNSLGSLVLSFLIVFGVIASVIAHNCVAGIAFDALLIAVLSMKTQLWRAQQRDCLRESVPEVINIMAECFQAGYSLVQTMNMVAKQSQGFLSKVFSHCSHSLQYGSSTGEALSILQKETRVEELRFLSIALDVQHRTGGSIVTILGSVQKVVQDKIELRRSLRVQTAQARISAQVVSLMPFILIALLSQVSDGFLLPFFSSAFGIALFIIALLLELSGVFLVRKMLKAGEEAWQTARL